MKYEGTNQVAWMSRLICAFAVHIQYHDMAHTCIANRWKQETKQMMI